MKKEYIERGELLADIADTVVFSVRSNLKHPTNEMRGANKVINRIKSAPAVDVEDVVRCHECRFREDHPSDTSRIECPLLHCVVDYDFYCAYGKKRIVEG